MSEEEFLALPIISGEVTLFHNDSYRVPLYQRAFAWSNDEICQLIDDIADFKEDAYYLGSLIVKKITNDKDTKKNVYEVIDGQQRLTALFLLLHYLQKNTWGSNKLCYECRDKSNYTLNNLTGLLNTDSKSNNIDDTKIEITDSLIEGYDIIQGKFNGNLNNGIPINKDNFIEQLKKVWIFRIEVPEHTDLNRYFEIMNMRGEQLEQHDIVKANLMKVLDDERERNVFALVWDACRDMTGYVQMHFTEVAYREKLFGQEWNCLNENKIFIFEDKKDTNKPDKADSYTIYDIVKLCDENPIDNKIVKENKSDGVNEDNVRIRFKSIIEFPYFLLHVLNVFVNEELQLKLDDKTLPKTMDDKKLNDRFEAVKKDVARMVSEKEFSQRFIKCLLKCRFLFDKYIIKREYPSDESVVKGRRKQDDDEGIWSLEELKQSSRKAQYVNTYFKNFRQADKTYKTVKDIRHANILMLQSCLRVSYTSSKSMNWITGVLSWLYNNKNRKYISNLEIQTEKIIQKAARENFLNCKNYCMGLNTPHIAFNYLDYLLWRDHRDDYNIDFKNFSFKFRNTVEHWYPQHPTDKLPEWDKSIRDSFGNLCLLQRGVNSKFSNLNPEGKSSYAENINDAALKLRIMSHITKENNWTETEVKQHGDEMLKLLCKACDVQFVPNMV